MTGRRRAIALVALAAALPLAACSSAPARTEAASAASSAPAAAYNDQDVLFLQMMVTHHEQGLEMAGLAADRAEREQVRTLAAAVKATEAEELKLIKSWLGTWSKPATSEEAAQTHLHHGAAPATGAKELNALRKAKGAGFEPAFLNLFIGHQGSAVEMAQTEQSKGASPDAKAFAGRVVESRTGEIRQMLRLLNS
ncbi:lipoprotein [Mycobacterium tuberculosis]|nr:lipoprotein [Mycobacterium tuberculosis]